MVISRRRFAENLKEMHGIKRSTCRACKTFVFVNEVCKFCGVVAAVASLILNSLMTCENDETSYFYPLFFKFLKCFLRKVFLQFFRAKNGRGSNKKWAWRQYKNLSPFHSSVIFVVFHPFYLPLVAAVNQNLKVILLKKEST